MLDQNKTPVFTAMKAYRERNVIPFDVPGHKHGRGLSEYKAYFGDAMLELDVNSMKPLDFLGNPTSVIQEAETLLAEAFGADRGYFIVNGTSFAVQTMIMATVTTGDKIILPRNVHKSAINALILSGAHPVFMEPELDSEMGVSHNITLDSLKKAYTAHPDSKAVLIINPTYYGAVSDLKTIVDFCHTHNMFALVDEAHGTHFHFNEKFPLSGMQAGADMSAVSLHKTGGSLTQSSALLLKETRLDGNYVRKVINLMQTTSPSYLLIGSLDVARKQLALHGHDMLNHILSVADYARNAINAIPGCYAIGKESIGRPGIFHFDPTKLSVTTRNMGLNGMELYDLLRDSYNIQMETGDVYNSLAILSLGDDFDHVDALIAALKDISQKHQNSRIDYPKIDLHFPEVVLTPREAFYAEKETIPLDETLGRISAESLMSYPPGIPVISYGERINASVIEQIKLFKTSHGILTGMEDPKANTIKVVK
ncbi:aminotransferase class I/II-fold pyridoxal phosphate-dependent enzyme [Fusibacter tunisiensis]|uniref:Arginine/lysine/ornithine decarboxylase n=1 Tax=Fusibacter tunisiensis TaxID=1008308 RepID=A0ABS2MRK1_9FIRM|nr:aminotransferase class I/II-fold pyridoxal phosphate-dependent enzyme [Fusibacter tunisiensis]MBM7562015.1 arginine/lysine/ornithine decarboxylase [Fusibacter tunisiensis]